MLNSSEVFRQDAFNEFTENTLLLPHAYTALGYLVLGLNSGADDSGKIAQLDTVINCPSEVDESLVQIMSEFMGHLRALSGSGKRFVRGTLLKFLKVLIQLNEVNGVEDENEQEVNLIIFGEVMKDQTIFCQFWNDLSRENDLFVKFVKDYLGRFPFDTLGFLDMVMHLSGSSELSFHKELVEMLAHLELITSEVRHFNYARRDSQDSHGREMYVLQEDIEIQAGIHVPDGTLFFFQNKKKLVCFQGDWNFWEIIWRQLTSLINGAQDNYDFHDHQRKLIHCFCQLIRECPNLLGTIEALMLGKFDEVARPFGHEQGEGDDSRDEARTRSFDLLSFGKECGQDPGGMASILMLMELLKLSLEMEDSAKLIQSILSALLALLESSFNFKAQTVIHFYSLVCVSKLNVMHPFLNVQMFFESDPRELETWTESETTRLQVHWLVSEICVKLIENNDILLAELREREDLNNVHSQLDRDNVEQMFNSLDNLHLDALTQELMSQIFHSYEVLFAGPHWTSSALTLASLLQKYDIRDYTYGNGFLETILNDVLVGGCRKILNHDFEVNEANQSLKYRVMASLMRFAETFVDKFRSVSGALDVFARQTEDRAVRVTDLKTKISVQEKLQNILGNLPVAELVLECLECRVHLDSFAQKGQPASLESRRTVENKHWVFNVIQKKNEGSRKSIREYLVSGVDLLHKCVLVLTGKASEPNNHLFKEIKDIIGQKDNIYKFSFAHQSQTKSANLLVAICSLVGFDDKKNLGRLSPSTNLYKNLRIGIIEDMFVTSSSPEAVLNSLRSHELFNHVNGTNVDLQVPLRRSHKKEILSLTRKVDSGSHSKLELIRNRLYQDETFLRLSCLRLLSQSVSSRADSLSCSVLQLLSSLSVYWSFNSKLTRPDLLEFLSGRYNDLPNAQFIFNL